MPLFALAGMRFILGLNFYRQNVSLAMEQMDAALAHLPRKAIVAFEVGNEVSTTLEAEERQQQQWVQSQGVATSHNVNSVLLAKQRI